MDAPCLTFDTKIQRCAKQSEHAIYKSVIRPGISAAGLKVTRINCIGRVVLKTCLTGK
jgi:hypothetical protein